MSTGASRFVTQEGVTTFALEGETLFVTDQRALPNEERTIACTSVEDVAAAIETLAVRGAPAIGGVAALGTALAALRAQTRDVDQLVRTLDDAIARLRRTRPTAVNLFVALDHMASVIAGAPRTVDDITAAVVDGAKSFCRADADMCEKMGAHGSALFDDGDRVLTICHTGALATCGIGTALGAIRTAHEAGKRIHVFALETRPLLQGARLTAWECMKLGIPVTLLTDGMAAFAFARQGITKAISGADRIAVNGDTANKIGTYGLALLARAHAVPFYVVAPTTTFHAATETGASIVVEERGADEVRTPRGVSFAPPDVDVWNPAFDVTPAGLIHAFVDENGVRSVAA
jgi:methylthioribose-1-phosphate isomerase